MFVIFTKQKGHWKFYSFVSSNENLQSELKHLEDTRVEAKTHAVQKFDPDQIKEIESLLNNDSK